MISLTQIWKDKGISIGTKKRLLKSLVVSIASYGSECWVLKKSDEKKIEAFELWCYRRLLRISWTDRKSNEWVLEKIDCKETLLEILTDERCLLLVTFSGVKTSAAICLWVACTETEAEVDRKRDTVTTLGKELELIVL